MVSHMSRKEREKSPKAKRWTIQHVKVLNLMNVEAENFQKIYGADIDEYFVDEYMQFRNILPAIRVPAEQLKKLKERKVEHTFPNVDTCLRVLLSMPISNASGERSFSTLKRIKDHLRSNLKQEKLNHLILLCVESDITCKLDFEDVISVFAEKRAGRNFNCC
ncbi:hypothetical protein JTE90_008276 [Oedothorax gibbosus]|uniref:HAT C-terminal dimerisation domain-containing protein n=1 Tax=Oedothorax gibbosus TaxID=931172 RepID=A0AAV6UH34_9ARAC|nr:hypothetical protein JTE90_008276 [Oedothorax gibbosus]